MWHLSDNQSKKRQTCDQLKYFPCGTEQFCGERRPRFSSSPAHWLQKKIMEKKTLWRKKILGITRSKKIIHLGRRFSFCCCVLYPTSSAQSEYSLDSLLITVNNQWKITQVTHQPWAVKWLLCHAYSTQRYSQNLVFTWIKGVRF